MKRASAQVFADSFVPEDLPFEFEAGAASDADFDSLDDGAEAGAALSPEPDEAVPLSELAASFFVPSEVWAAAPSPSLADAVVRLSVL